MVEQSVYTGKVGGSSPSPRTIIVKKFTRTIENFSCKNCKTEVKGDGYTNHCPKCLWSRHVDVSPGDRQEKCCGMMKPVDVVGKNGKFFLVHKCILCNHEVKNGVSKNDDWNTVTATSKEKQI